MDNKLKHLDFLQLVITRMNVNSFLIKGWAITLVAATFAFAAKDSNPKYVWITIVTTVIFWGLDGYYLSLERQYRKLYDEIRVKSSNEIDFDMNASKYSKGTATWHWSTVSFTIVVFYVTIIALSITLSLIIR